MSFKNDTEYPVLIRGINTRSGSIGYVTFQMYGVPTDRKVVIGPPTVKNVRRATDTVQYTKSKPKGFSERIEYPVDGKDVWRTVTVYENGKILRRTTYYSHYAVICRA
jgi:vancomycin resistance protein YoaR